MANFGERRIYYNNFASHLLNTYNPNMLYPGLPYAWTDKNWQGVIDMIAAYGYNVWEFWLVPQLFCRDAFDADYGKAFMRQLNATIAYAHTRGVKVEMLCSLATVGAAWHTLCPNVAEEWLEAHWLWDTWTRALPELDIVGIFPGDPGACSRNGCTAETYIDKAVEIAALAKCNLPDSEIEFHTWGSPFFGWGNIEGPGNWQGEFILSYQHTAWRFDKARADRSMAYLIKRLPDFPADTSVAINMGFNPDGNPLGDEDARDWVREIAQSRRVHSWDFSLTEGENNVVPHYRFKRLFERRQLERECGVYSGGICYTMTPLLNQLSLYVAAQSFLRPDADPNGLAGDYYEALFGIEGRQLVPDLHLFEVIQDWGNYHYIDIPRGVYHLRMCKLVERLQDLEGCTSKDHAIYPSPEEHRKDLLIFADLFAKLSAPSPDYNALGQTYWNHVYAIYDQLPDHVDPRPRNATLQLLQYFTNGNSGQSAIPGKWVE